MKFYKYLYIGDNINNVFAIKERLRIHAVTNAYVICLAQGTDQLEIYHAAYLKQKYYRKHPPIIVGIASDYDEAVEIVIKITKESIEHTGTCNLKDYLIIKAKTKCFENGVSL